jgi:hypothetical protein
VVGDREDVEAAGGVSPLEVGERVRPVVRALRVVVEVDELPAVGNAYGCVSSRQFYE